VQISGTLRLIFLFRINQQSASCQLISRVTFNYCTTTWSNCQNRTATISVYWFPISQTRTPNSFDHKHYILRFLIQDSLKFLNKGNCCSGGIVPHSLPPASPQQFRFPSSNQSFSVFMSFKQNGVKFVTPDPERNY
jgi:hypothetical protein